MTGDTYRDKYPTDATDVQVGQKDDPFVFTVDPMSALLLFRTIYDVAQKHGIEELGQNTIGRLVLTETDDIFLGWGPDAILKPRVYKDEEARDEAKDPKGLLASEVRQTHKLNLITALLQDGGGGVAAAGFRAVPGSGEPGTDGKGVRDPS